MEKVKREELQLDDSVKQNNKGQVILGRLTGPCADFLNPTRNGRQYDETLWEKVFNDPIVNEYFEAGGIPGELDHPTDRLDTCSEKIAIMMPEKPTKDKDGHLIASFDILDTPNGRIVWTLAKYGYKLGISSRGNGEVYDGDDGNEHVDEDSYDFRAFDIVLLPAVKAARLKMVESLQNGKSFKQAINEALDKANADEKKVMQETLDNLKIDYKDQQNSKKEIKSKIDDAENINESNMAANNVGADVIKELQETLLVKQKLETMVTELQEKLSVCYAKEAKYEEDLNKHKSAIQNLSLQAKSAKALKTKVESLEKELKTKDATLNESQNRDNQIKSIKDSKIKSLTENLSTKEVELRKANGEISLLKENINAIKKANETKIQALNEELAEQKKNLSIKTVEYSNKLGKSNKLVEQYRNTAKIAVNKYIESQATRLGVKSQEITSKLPSNYSFNDIDNICEELSSFKLRISDLPFNLDKPVKAKITEAKENSSLKVNNSFDEMVDEDLYRVAGIH